MIDAKDIMRFLKAGDTLDPNGTAHMEEADEIARADAFKAALMALDDETAPEPLPAGPLTPGGTETGGRRFSLDDLLEGQGAWPTRVDIYDERDDALFVVYDTRAHPHPVLSKVRSDTAAADAVLMLDGMPLALVRGGAGMDLAKVTLIPEALLPHRIAAAM